MPQYSWITFLQARQSLAARLADPGEVFWSDQEIGLYLIEALRTWNALTEVWNADFAFSPTSGQTWYDVSQLAGSPRVRTLTDTDIYTIMQYHLLEPPSGSVWTGTSQFALSDLQLALQRRRDEMIQVSGCNLAELPPLPSTPNTRRTMFPDSTLEPRRARFVPDSGSPTTLSRSDNYAWDGFIPDHGQVSKTPRAWSVIAGPPLMMDVDFAPNVAGTYDVISLQAGPTFQPPGSTLLGVPDDWSWLAKWGALADLLSRESEATDRQRADYCLKRFNEGLKVMKESNWLLTAAINGLPVDTPSVYEMDGYSPEWEENTAAWRSVVTAGMDFVAPCPVAGLNPIGVSMILVGNAPCPILDSDFVQVSRDTFDAILDYAQRLASFKQGGSEFDQTKDLEKNFFMVATETNKRLAKMGIFRDLLGLQGKRQDINRPR